MDRQRDAAGIVRGGLNRLAGHRGIPVQRSGSRFKMNGLADRHRRGPRTVQGMHSVCRAVGFGGLGDDLLASDHVGQNLRRPAGADARA